jgi:hypothetical protein
MLVIKFYEIPSVVAELFHADGETDIEKNEANSRFPKFLERAWNMARNK